MLLIKTNGANYVPRAVPIREQIQFDHVRLVLSWSNPPQFIRWPLLVEERQTATPNAWRHEVPKIHEPTGHSEQTTLVASSGMVPRRGKQQTQTKHPVVL